MIKEKYPSPIRNFSSLVKRHLHPICEQVEDWGHPLTPPHPPDYGPKEGLSVRSPTPSWVPAPTSRLALNSTRSRSLAGAAKSLPYLLRSFCLRIRAIVRPLIRPPFDKSPRKEPGPGATDFRPSDTAYIFHPPGVFFVHLKKSKVQSTFLKNFLSPNFFFSIFFFSCPWPTWVRHHEPHHAEGQSSSLTGGTLRPKSVFFTQTLGTCTARRHQPEGPPITGTAAGYVFSCVRKF